MSLVYYTSILLFSLLVHKHLISDFFAAFLFTITPLIISIHASAQVSLHQWAIDNPTCKCLVYGANENLSFNPFCLRAGSNKAALQRQTSSVLLDQFI